MKTDTNGLTMNQLAERNAEHVTTIAALESRCAALAAENVRTTSFINAYLDIAIQGGALDGFDVQELALKHGLLRKEEYCAERHRDMVYATDLKDGDDVYFRVENPATDAYLAEVRADARNELLTAFSNSIKRAGLTDGDSVTTFEARDALKHCVEQLNEGDAQ
ncbi:hypothetical protein OP853_000014 [Salmonella enterica]|nr:hypothetical protein [Salmonella enterica]